MTEAMKLGGFTDEKAKSKSTKMRIHRQYPRAYVATQNKGVPIFVDAKSLESNMFSMLGGSNKSLH